MMATTVRNRQREKPGLPRRTSKAAQRPVLDIGLASEEGPGLMTWLIAIAILSAFIALIVNFWNVSTY
jgi:hypothetical protein